MLKKKVQLLERVEAKFNVRIQSVYVFTCCTVLI